MNVPIPKGKNGGRTEAQSKVSQTPSRANTKSCNSTLGLGLVLESSQLLGVWSAVSSSSAAWAQPLSGVHPTPAAFFSRCCMVLGSPLQLVFHLCTVTSQGLLAGGLSGSLELWYNAHGSCNPESFTPAKLVACGCCHQVLLPSLCGDHSCTGF